MKREDCKDCVCLVCGNNNEWICDEKEKMVEDIIECPEKEK